MIAFTKLGNYGRLGNQLFQYAFLRVTARRLGTQFYCPRWEGDAIFELGDEGERAAEPAGLVKSWGPGDQPGFTEAALGIEDGTDIEGYFQSERYFPDKAAVRSWFRFAPAIRAEVDRRFAGVPLDDCVTFSLRIDGDYARIREYFPLYPVDYYERALDVVRARGPIVVLADRPDLARGFLSGLRARRETIYVENLGPAEQLYLMSRCRDNVITNSTFAWWGAWLNPRPDKVVVAATAWNRPGIPKPIEGILCEDWRTIRGTTPILDHFQVWRLRHPVATIERVWRRVSARAKRAAGA